MMNLKNELNKLLKENERRDLYIIFKDSKGNIIETEERRYVNYMNTYINFLNETCYIEELFKSLDNNTLVVVYIDKKLDYENEKQKFLNYIQDCILCALNYEEKEDIMCQLIYVKGMITEGYCLNVIDRTETEFLIEIVDDSISNINKCIQ